jgi:hypothetical protein
MTGDQSKQYLQELVRQGQERSRAIGYQQLTVAGSVVTLTIPTNAIRAIMVLESNLTTIAIRYNEDGSVPSSGVGMPMFNGDAREVTMADNLTSFQAIQEGAGTHKLNITYYMA